VGSELNEPNDNSASVIKEQGLRMDKNTIWKWLILVLLVVGSLAVVTPPFDKVDEEGNVVRQGKIRFGLDLEGGTSFVVKIDEDDLRREIESRGVALTPEQVEEEVKKVLEGAQERALEVMRNRVDNLGISEPIIYLGKDNRIIIQLPGADEAKRKEAEISIKSLAYLEFRVVHQDSDTLTGSLFDQGLVPEGYKIERVEGQAYYRKDLSFPDSKRDRKYRITLGKFNVPDPGFELLMEKRDIQGVEVYVPHFVKRRSELTGKYLKDAAVDFKQLGQPVVQIEFDGKGSKRFAKVTRDLAPGGAQNQSQDSYRKLAIVLDGTLYSAPIIREPIHGGRAEISGSFTLPEANFLRNILKAGSLPAPVKIVETRFVAPSLGSDSIESGVRSIIYGAVGVVSFMVIYYMVSGVIADLALILNMILLPLGMIIAAGFLGIFAKDATSGGPITLPVLTLPGIAGILLTIGMAVDANVLIFERIREEAKSGKRLWSSITAGYDRAFVTILDANLTTMLTGIILFVFGSGPIRGFAVTLCAGIMASMFTALVVTKLFFQLLATRTNIKELKMLSAIKDTAVDFIGKRKFAAIVSLAVIVVSLGIMGYRGIQDSAAIFGVDFRGGASVVFSRDMAQEKIDVEDIRSALSDAGVNESHIQYQGVQVGGDEYLQVKTSSGSTEGTRMVDVVKKALNDTFPAAGFVVEQEDEVGPQVGAELKTRALWSILMALLGIIIYISWRFELGFAIGAIVALAHDVLVTVGIYTLCGRQLSLPIVAALLTIVGYSVNDTIVVFDRIREDLKLVRDKSFKEICNLSINQTLSRTLLTSLTTLITVVMLLVFGGGAINDFALALFIGVLVGTYSSIFVATPVVLLWHRDRRPGFAK
jgi:SecD/SecF fusion protein